MTEAKDSIIEQLHLPLVVQVGGHISRLQLVEDALLDYQLFGDHQRQLLIADCEDMAGDPNEPNRGYGAYVLERLAQEPNLSVYGNAKLGTVWFLGDLIETVIDA